MCAPWRQMVESLPMVCSSLVSPWKQAARTAGTSNNKVERHMLLHPTIEQSIPPTHKLKENNFVCDYCHLLRLSST